MLTALNSGSALGLITSCISSFKDTKGSNCPPGSVVREGGAAVADVDEGGGDAGFEDEQLDASSPKTPAAKAPTTTTARGAFMRLPLRFERRGLAEFRRVDRHIDLH